MKTTTNFFFSNMNNKLLQVIKFEFLRVVKTKGFLLGVFLMPTIMIVSFFTSKFFAEKSEDHSNEIINIGVYISNNDSIMDEIISSIKELNWKTIASNDSSTLRQMTFDKKIKGYVSYDSKQGYNFYADNFSEIYISNAINTIVYNINRRQEIMRSGLSQAQINKILNPSSLNTYKINPNKPESAETSDIHEESFKRVLCGIFFAFLIMMSVMIFSQSTGNSVLEDKSSKIIDVLLTSVKPTELLAGKILGIGGAGLLQFSVWILISIVAVFVMESSPIAGLKDFFTPQLYMFATIFFVLGYTMITSVYAALGSMAETQQHYNQLISAVTFVLVMPSFALTPVATNPESTFSIVISMLPIFSSSLMPVRIMSGGVPIWQILLSILIIIITGLIILKTAAKIFKHAIMQQGKEFGVKDMLKWLSLKR